MVCITGPLRAHREPNMTQLPPATRDEVVMLLGEIDVWYVDRILDIGASIDEISEAIGALEGRLAEPQNLPSTARVAEVREVLRELTEAALGSHTFPLPAVPEGHPI